jgi:hypothetical protein
VRGAVAFLRVVGQNPGAQSWVRTVAFCPGCGVSSSSSPDYRKRCFHRMMVGALVCGLDDHHRLPLVSMT